MIQDDQGCCDLEFAWNDGPTVDLVAQANVDDLALRNGSATIDEVRARRGEGPLPNGEGARAWSYAGGPQAPRFGTGADTAEPETRRDPAVRA